MPRISIDSKSGGEIRAPDTAVRSGPKAKRGLILHHRRSEKFRKGEPPPRLSEEMLARIDTALSIEGRGSASSGPMKPSPATLLGEYADPLADGSRQAYWGAVERVIVTQPGSEPQDTGWLVLVQEPVSR